MQPLKTYEVQLRKTRLFKRTVSVQASCLHDALVVAKYDRDNTYSHVWAEDDSAECIQSIDAVEKSDFNKAREHYNAQVTLADATIPGMETEA